VSIAVISNLQEGEKNQDRRKGRRFQGKRKEEKDGSNTHTHTNEEEGSQVLLLFRSCYIPTHVFCSRFMFRSFWDRPSALLSTLPSLHHPHLRLRLFTVQYSTVRRRRCRYTLSLSLSLSLVQPSPIVDLILTQASSSSPCPSHTPCFRQGR